jgi:hypothetical protein
MKSILVPTIVCPRCHAELDVHKELCPHCHSSLVVSDSTKLLTGDEERQKVLDRPWVIAVLLLHVGLLGIPIYWKTSYSVQTRLLICLLSVVYTVFAVGFIVSVGSYLYRKLVLGG